MELIGLIVFFLGLPVWLTIICYVFVVSTAWLFDDLDTVDNSWSTFIEMVLFVYAHFIGRWFLIINRPRLAAKIYAVSGAYVYRRDSGLCVSHHLPEGVEPY